MFSNAIDVRQGGTRVMGRMAGQCVVWQVYADVFGYFLSDWNMEDPSLISLQVVEIQAVLLNDELLHGLKMNG